MAEGRLRNRIRQRWDAGKPVVACWLNIPSAQHAELLATIGFDCLIVDLQHSAIDFSTAVSMLTAIEARGCEPLVRIKVNDAADIGKLLDNGAYGIIAPLVNDAADAEAFAAALHYPPHGSRSYGPRRPMIRWGPNYIEQASESIVSLAMIETLCGFENIDKILAVPGFDGVFIGPADLALAFGAAPSADPTDPVILRAIRHIRERASAAGRRTGIYCGSAAAARRWIDEGFDLVSVGSDLQMLATAARNALVEARG